jgi:hypothetical protein
MVQKKLWEGEKKQTKTRKHTPGQKYVIRFRRRGVSLHAEHAAMRGGAPLSVGRNHTSLPFRGCSVGSVPERFVVEASCRKWALQGEAHLKRRTVRLLGGVAAGRCVPDLQGTQVEEPVCQPWLCTCLFLGGFSIWACSGW